MLDLLEKQDNPLSLGEIAKLLNDDPKKISKDLNKMLQYNEVCSIEIDRKKAMLHYKCKHRMRLYFVK